jgi:hypothetical protein
MTITLPDELRDELDRRAKANGFASVDQYVAELIRMEDEVVALPNPPDGARYAVKTREELEAKLLEGMNRVGDVKITRQD